MSEKAATRTAKKMLTFNMQTLENIHRLHETANELKHQKVHIASIQGTCWGITNTWEMDEDAIHQSGKEKGVEHKHAGVLMLILKFISKGGPEQIYNTQQGRAVAVQISDRHVDITAIPLHIPTEESNNADTTRHGTR